MINLHTKFHIPSSNVSLPITITIRVKYRILQKTTNLNYGLVRVCPKRPQVSLVTLRLCVGH
jgi:hypothetical protein